jgi:uncharacterized protein YpiB (UPF0302 family)
VEIGSSILTEHKQAGLVRSRTKRKNHKSTGIDLLAVPRYSDLLEDMEAEDESERGRALVTSEAGWRTEMAKWIGDARAAEDAEDGDSENETPAAAMPRIRVSQQKPMTLATLFGGKVRRTERLTVISEEEMLMEALAEQMEDERLDDGAIEQEGDDYEP